MPLRELYRMAKAQPDSEDINSTCVADQGSAPENDFFELVWENGQISMQGPSSRARKSPTCKSLPSHSAKIRDKDVGNGTKTRMGEFGDLDSGLNEFPMSVPSGEVNLSPDEDMVPWLNYTIDDYLQQEYNSDLLHGLSGDAVNDIPASDNFSLMDKRHNCNQEFRDSYKNPVHDVSSSEPGIICKGFSAEVQTTRTKATTSQLYLPSSLRSQTSLVPVRSRVSGITENNTSNATQHDLYGETTQIPSTSNGFSSLKMQKHDPTIPSTSSTSTIMNFSHFARPVAIMRANLQSIGKISGFSLGRSEIMVNKNKDAAVTSSNPPEPILTGSRSELPRESNMHCQQQHMESSKADLKLLEPKSLEQNLAATKQSDPACKKDSFNNDQTSNHVFGESCSKGYTAVEGSMEQVVASSSVCSGNGVERASDNSNQNLKRKSQDTEDSECHSDDVEEESVGVKKAAHAHGTCSKRSRAAEVHNLSERRRRDRINEKMRALQELIPNCNKVDKASMLDEAIEYLKSLQLQVQMMSMGAGLYMPPMMVHPGMQHMHVPISPFPPIGVGMQMGLGMGYGIGMPDINGGLSRFPMIQVPQLQGTHLSVPPMSGPIALHGMARSNPQMFGLPCQGLPLPMTRAPGMPLSGGPLMNSSALGLNACGTSGLANVDSASASGLKDPISTINSQVMQSAAGSNPTNQTSTQCEATKVGLEESALAHNSGHASDADDRGAVNPGKEDKLLTDKNVMNDDQH